MELIIASEEERRSRDLLTHAAWGQRLSVADFRSREDQLRGHPWAREAMVTWLLAGDREQVLASCETFRMRSLRRTPAGPRKGFTYGIGSVYTDPALRGRGYARQLMGELMRRLVRDDPDAQASILFSEVGPTLYRRSGFVERPWEVRIIPARPSSIPTGVRLLDEAELAEALATIPMPADPFVVWPTAGQLDWHLERERAYARLLHRPRPVACGAAGGDGVLLWAADRKLDRLYVLVGHAPDAASAAPLARAASHVAAQAGLGSVHVWETAALPLPRDLGRREPAEDIPMLRPLLPDLEPSEWRTIPRGIWM